MSERNCIFCKIANKEIKTDILLESDDYVAFRDMHPQAPFHALIIPKKHYDSLNAVDDIEITGKLLEGAKKLAEKYSIKNGYRIIINTGEEAGQTVFHIHLHVLGGRPMLWPPG